MFALLFVIIAGLAAIFLCIVAIFGLPYWFIWHSGWEEWLSWPAAFFALVGMMIAMSMAGE